MFVKLLKEDLKSWAYDASLAGLRYSLEMTTVGLQLSVGGYSSTVNEEKGSLCVARRRRGRENVKGGFRLATYTVRVEEAWCTL